jgi:hypothetical protein
MFKPIAGQVTESSVLPPGDTATAAQQHPPVLGISQTNVPAVSGVSDSTGIGVLGQSKSADGVHGESNGSGTSAVSGIHHAGGHGVYGKSSGNAGAFDGNVQINGDATISGKLTVNGDIYLPGADCAEQFDAADESSIEPGSLLVVDDSGALKESDGAYDRRVVGVVAGGGKYRPGVILDKGPSDACRVVVSLMGKAYCKVDASFGSIRVGDLLTSSPIRGHAMRADNPSRAFGAVVGKALGPMPIGKGLIPILLALQ